MKSRYSTIGSSSAFESTLDKMKASPYRHGLHTTANGMQCTLRLCASRPSRWTGGIVGSVQLPSDSLGSPQRHEFRMPPGWSGAQLKRRFGLHYCRALASRGLRNGQAALCSWFEAHKKAEKRMLAEIDKGEHKGRQDVYTEMSEDDIAYWWNAAGKPLRTRAGVEKAFAAGRSVERVEAQDKKTD